MCEQKRTAALASCLLLCIAQLLPKEPLQGRGLGRSVKLLQGDPADIVPGKLIHMHLHQGMLNFSWVTKSKDNEVKLPRFKSWLCRLAFQLVDVRQVT